MVTVARETPADRPAVRAVVGHVLFAPVRVGDAGEALVLAPLAVAPGRQGEGIGSRLVREGLERARDLGYRVVVLHGAPGFYRRFGFRPAGRYAIENPEETPPEEFMVLALVPGALASVEGAVRYPAAFEAVLG
jgi:putative acetyltransferase